MSCENCYHNEVCEALWKMNGIPRIGKSQCAYFRDKSCLIEAPAKLKPTITVSRKEFCNRIEVVKNVRYEWNEAQFCFSKDEADLVEDKWKGE